MKKSIVLIAALCCTANAFAWGELGHATIAQIAQNHLTPQATKMVAEYLDGQTLADVASEADHHRSEWVMDLGFIPTNPEEARKYAPDFDTSLPLNFAPYSHSYTVDKQYKPYPSDNMDGAYVNNNVYYVEILTEKIRNHASEMSCDERRRALCVIVHMLGDMHCPVHIIYEDFPHNKGKFKVTYHGKQCSYHTFWDGKVFANEDRDYKNLAQTVDSVNPKQIGKISKGTVRDWAEDSARKSFAIYDGIGPYVTLPDNITFEFRPLLYSQLRNGGYRLAALLNDLFCTEKASD